MPLNKTAINFSMVYIPITYTPMLKNNEIDFRMLEKHTLSKIRYKKVCDANLNKEVLNKDIVKGYEYEKDKYVIFDSKDFEKLKTTKDRNITIEKFVDIDDIDPIYFDRPYLINSSGADHAFALLCQAMQNTKKVGIAKTVIGQKETLLLLRAKDNRLYFNSLFFYDNLKKDDSIALNEKFSKEEIKLAENLIENMSGKFNPKDYKDHYKEKIKEAINKKLAGKKITKAKETSSKKISNLMDALNESIKATNRKKKTK